jgi:hypothetical protein
VTASERDLRAALQSVYGFGDGYPDEAVVDRIATGAKIGRTQYRPPRWVVGAAVSVASLGLGLAVILTMLSIPRGAAPAAAPSARPSQSTVFAKQSRLSFVIAGGTITFDGQDLPPDAKVDITVHQGGVSGEFFTTTNAQGIAHTTVPEPFSLAPGTADFSICVEPSKNASAAWKCVAEQVRVPNDRSSLPAPTPSCPPGTWETGRSTPAPNGSYWLGCLGTVPTEGP